MRMYFNFRTNLPDTVDDKPTVQVENFTFKTSVGLISVGCIGDSDFGVTQGIYDARFKGLEFYIEDEDNNTILDWDEKPTDEQLEALMKGELIKVSFTWDDYFNIPEGILPTAEDIDLEIEIDDNRVAEFSVKQALEVEYL